MEKQKSYIGAGTKFGQYGSISVVLNMDEAQAHVYEHEGKHFLKFTLSNRKEVSEKGSTHYAFVQMREQPEEANVASEPKPKRKGKKNSGETAQA